MAGAMNAGRKMVSRSRNSLTRTRQGKRVVVATGRVPIAMSSLPRYDLLHLGLGPGDSLLRRRARHRLGDHVRQEVRVGDELHLLGGWRGPTIDVILHALPLEGRVLGI